MGNQTQTAGAGNSLDAIASLLQLFQGTNTKTTQSQSTAGFSETTDPGLDQEALAGLLKQALESNQGLAATAQGQRGAGLYNSSTNRLMTNDLLARLTTNAAAAGASKTVTRTPTSAGTTTTNQQVGGIQSGGTDLAKVMSAIKLYNEAGKTDIGKKLKAGVGSLLDSSAADGADYGSPTMAVSSDGMSAMDSPMFSANSAISNVTDQSFLSGGNADMSFMFASPAESYDFSAGVDTAGTDAGTYVDTAASSGETAGNFPTALANQSMTGSAGSNPSSSEILSGANTSSADTTSLSNAASVTGGGISTVSSSAGVASASGVGVDASGNLTGYASNADLTSAYNAADGSSAVVASDLGDTTSAGGSVLGYVGPIMSALNAQNNPEGEQNKDYRHAVGGAVLNYFGFGWASPIVHAVAEPALNASMEAGEESLGAFGVVMADPIGAPLSGEYDVGTLVTSTLDPANIFGGNPGGSVGSVVALGVDPIGAMLGDKGVFSEVSDAVNRVDSALSPGRVVCTELALGGDISIAKYQKVIQPAITLKGRILLGYHILGVPAVRRLRADPVFRAKAVPYVNAYLDHKLGKWNWRGFLIKTIGEPICWVLSFFNTDPNYYQTLYPYRRNRNGT